jgi:hypothetical protein
MNNNQIFITINHLDEYNGLSNIKVGDTLTLKKDLDNPYDDEAIAVYNLEDIKVGYVANSVCTVARGTYSAGRIYDKIKDNESFLVRFIGNDFMIAESE